MEKSSSSPMEVQLKAYGSFKVQGNPLFECFDQIGNPMPKSFYENNNHDEESNELVGDLIEESSEEKYYDVVTLTLCSKSLDSKFLYGENVYFNPLFLEKGISIDDSQVGIQRQGLMAITPQIASCHRLYEGNTIGVLIYLCLNHQKDL